MTLEVITAISLCSLRTGYSAALLAPSEKFLSFNVQTAKSINQNQIFVYCVNVKEKTIHILIITLTEASMIYREKVPKFRI